MKLESDGILIGLRPFGERDLIAKVFTREHGILIGMLRGGAVAKNNRALVGQLGHVVWTARLDSQLGAFHWEPDTNLSVAAFKSSQTLMFFNSVIAMLDAMLPERAVYQDLYNITLDTLMRFDNVQDSEIYLKWEIALLQELGYAIDLSHCSGCGKTENLHYLSPKTCRAVCDACAAPYKDKLYRLPITLDITFRLLESVCLQQGITIPKMRFMLKQI